MDMTLFLLASLAVWRVTHMLHNHVGLEPGRAGRLRADPPLGWASLFRKLMRHPLAKAVDRVLRPTVGSFQLVSLWVAVPAAALLASHWREGVLIWLGLSAVAMLLDRATSRAPASPTPSEPVSSLFNEAALDSDFPVIQGFDTVLHASTPH
jgi:hypothetical protein